MKGEANLLFAAFDQLMFDNVYKDTTVLVTGHTGFKGAWLTAWLLELGADVIGYSEEAAPTDPSLFELTGLSEQVIDVRGDIRDWEKVWAVIEAHRPKIVFHLAAQPIVHLAAKDPKPTFDINAGGTVNVLEAVRKTDCVEAVLCITTDKVYDNKEWLYGYREIDRLGGKDPYSASKAMAELAIHAYRSTYFSPDTYAEHGVSIAATRAGNVIGGGDFGAYRLIPDCVKALMDTAPIGIRTPHSIRPWQHVLVPLSGYLWLGARMLEEGASLSDAWNFGPVEQRGVTTGEVVDKLIELWGSGSWIHFDPDLPKIDTGRLRLSWDKAADQLGWHPVYDWVDALTEIVAFFKAYEAREEMLPVLQKHIGHYVAKAEAMGLPWTQTL